MKRWARAVAAAVLLAAVCAADGVPRPRPVAATPLPAGAGTPGVGDAYLPGAGNGGYDVGHYSLDLRYDPNTGRLDGHAVLTVTATEPLGRFDLDYAGVPVSALTVDHAPARWQRDAGELVVTPAATIRAGTAFTVDARYAGVPGTGPDAKTVDTGFLRGKAGAVALGEPTGAAEWFPVNDHPRDKAGYDFAITVPDGWTAIANGTPEGTRGSPPGWTTWRWRADDPMASYLAMVAVGRFTIITGTAGSVPVYSAVAESLPWDKIGPVLGRTPEILGFLATRFGPYPFASAGGVVPDEPRLGYALETQTRPVYSQRYFGRAGADSTIAHELTHQWFGDSVTVHDWRDIWLNEGFATYGQWLWDEHEGRSNPQARFDQAYRAGENLTPPPGDPGAGDLFAPSVYLRGAMTLQVLRHAVGDDAFFAILRTWAERKRHGTGTSAEFLALADAVSGKSVTPLLRDWLYSKARPRYP